MTPHTMANGGVLQPFTMVIFGATGDLTERKLMPALYHLAADGYLPVDFSADRRRPP